MGAFQTREAGGAKFAIFPQISKKIVNLEKRNHITKGPTPEAKLNLRRETTARKNQNKKRDRRIRENAAADANDKE